MSNFYIQSEEQARAIIAAYEKCGTCSECPLHTPEGWRCSYLYNRACAYLTRNTAAE